jgi:hypothetical protein
LDPQGYHFLNCNHGVERNFRHDSVRNTLADIIRQSGHAAITEKTLQAMGVSLSRPDADKRVDIVCIRRTGISTALDTTVVNPVAASNLSTASRSPGATVLAAEKKKNAKYSAPLKAAGIEFIPAAVEVFGRWGPSMLPFLRSLLPPNAHLTDQGIYSKIISLWWRRLSVALQKGNAFMLTARSCTAIDANTAPHKRRQREPRWADFLLRDIA